MKEVEPFYKHLGILIQKRRIEQKKTQEYLGRQLEPNMTRASIANIEAGKQRVMAHTLIQLADVLEANLNELIPKPSKEKHAGPGELKAELVKKLNIPNKEVDELVEKIESSSYPTKRKDDEYTLRKSTGRKAD